MPKNAIVVMFDSLQFNYLGCYGNNWIKTPNFDRVAKEGVLFENSYAEGLPTVPCRRAMLSGRYTLPVSGWVAAGPDDTFIADVCWGQGIDTALVFDCPNYRLPKFGYTRGFDTVLFTHGHESDHSFYAAEPLYDGAPEDYIEDHILRHADAVLGGRVVEPLKEEIACFLKQQQYWRTDEDRYVAKTMKKALWYLEQADRTRPFFLWVDSFDPHEPWNPPSVYTDAPCPYDPDYAGKDQFLPLMCPVDGVYTEAELRHIRMLYAELITVCDKWLGWFLDRVRRLGLEENTLLMVLSDHGEPMGNGPHGHGILRKIRPWPYEEVAHTVMLLRGPGLPAGKRVKGFVQSCDVAPTVCDWLGLGPQSFHQGHSLLPLARGETDKVRDFAVAGYHKYSWSIITDEWSYIHWLKADEASLADAVYALYGEGIAKAGNGVEALASDPLLKNVCRAGAEPLNETQRKHLDAASLDGEDQWTCTPGAAAELPARDELYRRGEDPFQEHDLFEREPETARRLLRQLRDFMRELRGE